MVSQVRIISLSLYITSFLEVLRSLIFFPCFRMFLLLTKSNALLLIHPYYFVKVYLNFSAMLSAESLTESAER